jgi:hypothetical protein
MTRRTRYFLAGSAAVLALGLGAGLVAYYSGGLALLSAARTGPAELKYVPADAALVAYADVRSVMDSQFRQRVRDWVPESERGREAFQRETGIDLERDIDHVVACVLPKAGDDGGLVLARGHFDLGRLEAVAREHGAEAVEYRGTRILLLASGGPGREGDAAAEGRRRRGGLALIAPELVAVGDEASLRRAIDTGAGGANVTANAELMRLVAALDTDANAWAVGQFEALSGTRRLPAEVSQKLPPLKWFAASGRVDGGISGTLRAEASDETSAENLRDVIRGFFALAKMQAASDPKLQTMLQALELTGSGTTVAVSFALPADVIERLGRSARGGR